MGAGADVTAPFYPVRSPGGRFVQSAGGRFDTGGAAAQWETFSEISPATVLEVTGEVDWDVCCYDPGALVIAGSHLFTIIFGPGRETLASFPTLPVRVISTVSSGVVELGALLCPPPPPQSPPCPMVARAVVAPVGGVVVATASQWNLVDISPGFNLGSFAEDLEIQVLQ